MENNRKFHDYSIGYNPDAVEHDLKVISQLTHGRKKMTTQLAQEVYYKIKNENIKFQSETGESFLLSLHTYMTDAQIQEINRAVRQKKQRKQNRRQLVRLNRRIAAVVSAVVLVSSILCINWSLLMDFRTNYQTKKLQEKVIVTADNRKAGEPEPVPLSDGGAALIPDEAKTEGEVKAGNEVMPKFTQLYSENQDFAGWLRIAGTKIDYPVMSREGDNNYYLDKNFEQQYDKNGLLVLDYRNSIKNDAAAAGQNLIIYGHNMRTGVMFGTLKNYKDKSFCEEHMVISFDTLYEECEYRIVAAMLGSVAYEDEDVFRYYDAIDISTEENFKAFQDNIMSSALYVTGETIAYGDTCLILSTCDNYIEDGRFVVIAKKCN